MKTLLCILILFKGIQAGATHWLTYYVYYETEYIQGPWAPSGILSGPELRYLAVREYTDLFGTEKADLAEKMISRLKELHPAAYEMKYTLNLSGDTVILEMDPAPGSWDLIRNEVTATMTQNSFRAVCFILPDTVWVTTLSDVTLPYFDLVNNGSRAAGKEIITPEDPAPLPEKPSAGMSGGWNPARSGILIPALILSLLLNLILGIAIFLKRRTP